MCKAVVQKITLIDIWFSNRLLWRVDGETSGYFVRYVEV